MIVTGAWQPLEFILTARYTHSIASRGRKSKMIVRWFLVCTILLLTACKKTPTGPKAVSDQQFEPETPAIESLYPVPTPAQLAWEDAEMAMFVHFGMNTFTGNEWGDGTDSASLFNPTGLDVHQWVSVAKEAGFKYVILTAKHHDGFCLWPSKYTSYTIAASRYKNGTGDIVKQLSDACSEEGVSFSFYLSAWDRHEPSYGKDAYNEFFQNQLTELLTQYGKVGEVWFDDANGERDTGFVPTYNWDLFFSTVRHYQPEALMACYGPDIRWIGNENGTGFETEWSVQPRKYSIQPAASGDEVWFPSECDVSIRPGWFYHPQEDAQIKTVDQLTDIYFQTIGRNSNLLLNVPPNQKGAIADVDVQRLQEWRQRLDEIFSHDLFFGQQIVASSTRKDTAVYSAANCLDENRKTFWSAKQDSTTAQLVVTLQDSATINIVRLEEAIEYGQRVESFRIFYDGGQGWVECFQGTTIGRTRLAVFSPVTTRRIEVTIDASRAAPTINILEGYFSSLVHE